MDTVAARTVLKEQVEIRHQIGDRLRSVYQLMMWLAEENEHLRNKSFPLPKVYAQIETLTLLGNGECRLFYWDEDFLRCCTWQWRKDPPVFAGSLARVFNA